jgi:hypothetical protein
VDVSDHGFDREEQFRDRGCVMESGTGDFAGSMTSAATRSSNFSFAVLKSIMNIVGREESEKKAQMRDGDAEIITHYTNESDETGNWKELN